ncbi:hypothetical protein [Methylibium sp.]|uniref:hypothetical protein n=1 Tax=Methylibium sp. TaxID=2067992 RepID=UPI003BACA57B
MIFLPRWLDDELHGRGWVLAAVMLSALLFFGWLVWVRWSQPTDAVRPARVETALPQPVPLALPAAAEAVVAPASASPVVLPACPHQHVDITGADGLLQRGCLSATRTRQSGSVRSYVAQAEGVSNWHLTVDAAGGQVISVRLRQAAIGTSPERLYVCDDTACQGASLAAPDANGARALSLDDTRLQALPPGQRWRRPLPGAKRSPPAAGTAAGEVRPVVSLKATLSAQPDRNDAALACAGRGVTIVNSQGAVIDFCALGGAGFEVPDDGPMHFAFRDLEGRALAVAVGSDGTIDGVTLGALSCRGTRCGGVSMSVRGDTDNPSAERSFSFSGTTLYEAGPSGRPGATLNGGVTMPSQE